MDAHMGDKIINKHKENIVNIKKVATFVWKKAAVIGMRDLERLLLRPAKVYDVCGGVNSIVKITQ